MIESITSSISIDQIKEESNRFSPLFLQVNKIIVGQQETINFIMHAILCNGHVLLEGVPGVAKTTMVKAVAQGLGLSFNRIQFTPDLLPSDVIGTLIFNTKTQEFETKQGPIFANLILADEINRAPAKVQAALLEAMQEQQVTIGSKTYKLPEPFIVLATQNPIDQEGTYRLPEAQVDRFMFKLLVTYPDYHQEREILKRNLNTNQISPVLSAKDIQLMQELISSIYVDEKVLDYIINIVFATRKPEDFRLNDIAPYIQYGVSPRATLALRHASQCHAFFKGRHFVTPDDVKSVALPILRHRLIRTYEAEADQIENDTLIKKILNTIPTP